MQKWFVCAFHADRRITTFFGNSVWKKVLFTISVNCIMLAIGEDYFGGQIGCHDDPTYQPEEGPLSDVTFTWLGGLQYIHILNGTPHYFRLPRVVLVSRLFVISTAADAANVPEGYALGNIIFGDYERDEEECGLTLEQVAKGVECNPAVLLMPIADVLLHPEYKHFNIKNSLALLKLLSAVKSHYMLPVCLPVQDINKMAERTEKKRLDLYHIDYTSVVPRDFDEEEKELTVLHTLPPDKCYVMQKHNTNHTMDIYHRENNSDPIREICTTSCGLRSGAPTIIQEDTGHWTIVALAEGGSSCPDPLNLRDSIPPPVHILIQPYVQWITSALTGHPRQYYQKNDPFGFERRATDFEPRANVGYENREKKGWVGKWWMGGLRCYDRGEMSDDLFRFYHEVFLIHPNSDWENNINYYIELRIKLINFHLPYKIEIEAWGYRIDSEESESA